MSYVDAEFYNTVYRGTPVKDPVQFERLAERATEQVDVLTNFEIAATGIEIWPPIIADRIRKAAAAQVEYLAEVGITEANFSKGPTPDVSIGKFKITPKAKAQGLNGSKYSAGMIEHLTSSGLLHAGVCVRD